MPNLNILKIAIPRPLDTLFDYLPPLGSLVTEIPIGARVIVPFGRSTTIGFVVDSGESKIPKAKLKHVQEVLDEKNLFPERCWNFLCKAKEYYHHSLGEVLISGLPKIVKEGKPLSKFELVKNSFVEGQAQTAPPVLTSDQQLIVGQILGQTDNSPAKPQTYLLEGVTGSGKTEIYLQILLDIQKRGGSALILLPEISLTPQTLMRFQQRLVGKILIYHSKLTPKARYCVWRHIKENTGCIVIGTRSALFLPFDRLDALIVDEEHDASFKQQDGFRYSARDMAVLRGHIEACPVILGSATPSFESLHNTAQGKYQHLKLANRINQSNLPLIDIIDIRHKKLQGGLSSKLIDKVKQHTARGDQVLIFLNRRGYAPTYMCYECGWLAGCNRCDAQLIVHQAKSILKCHHCDKSYPKFNKCPECEHEMNPVGIGTEKLEESIEAAFPNINKLRVDSDTTRHKGNLEEKLEQISSGKAQIIIGTQLLAKGHHFPNITLVAIIDVDGGLFSADFRAVERMGQLITQVAGRAGRETKPGEVVLQSYHPEHPLLQRLIHDGYPQFAAHLLLERKQASLPPFAHIALISAQAKSAEKAELFLNQIKAKLKSQTKIVEVWGPISAIMSKKQGYYRFQLVLQSSERGPLHHLLAKWPEILNQNPLKSSVRWSLDVDPTEMR